MNMQQSDRSKIQPILVFFLHAKWKISELLWASKIFLYENLKFNPIDLGNWIKDYLSKNNMKKQWHE